MKSLRAYRHLYGALTALLLLLVCAAPVGAQNRRERRKTAQEQKVQEQKKDERQGAAPQRQQALGEVKVSGYPMFYRVDEKGDTVYMDSLDPVWIFPKGKKMGKGDWRRYYRLVHQFNKVYPYALAGRKMMAQVDSTLQADASKRSERNRYIKDVEKELFRLFEADIRGMTVREGLVLMRLVDRECGMNAFEIIKTYENGFAANFWQLVAKLFSQDLKTRYDPASNEEDARIEELCKIWDAGQWDGFYYSIFYEYPKKTVIKSERLQSEVRK